MRTAYDALQRAIVKDFGKWYSFEWKAVSNEVKPKIQSGELASKHWNSIFLPDLDNLCIGYRAFGEFFINGNLSNGADFGRTQGANTVNVLKRDGLIASFITNSFNSKVISRRHLETFGVCRL